MRVSAGEALTVLYEAAVQTMGVAYRFPNQQHLLEMLASLSTDSVKFRAKKDRRVQRFSFRQIYNAIKVSVVFVVWLLCSICSMRGYHHYHLYARGYRFV